MAFAAALLATGVAVAAPKKSAEMQAREAFAAGRYQEALDLYVKLYAEKLNPIYQRNIGRCYQNLGEPDKAISSFREYVRKARNLSADERKEIDGYIAEMEELKRKQSAPAQAEPAPPPRTEVTAAPPPPPPPLQPAQSHPVSQPIVTATPEASEPSSPVYARWWFWTAIAAVAAGTVAIVVATRPGDPSCDSGRICSK